MAKERRPLRSLTVGQVTGPRKKIPRRQVTIALDFDRSFTADRLLWRSFMTAANRLGHRLLCVTCRRDTAASRELIRESFGESFPILATVLFTNHTPKRAFAALHGYKVDIWIDDIPETIGGPTHHEVRDAEQRFPTGETLALVDD